MRVLSVSGCVVGPILDVTGGFYNVRSPLSGGGFRGMWLFWRGGAWREWIAGFHRAT
jgi:hypothetical protein